MAAFILCNKNLACSCTLLDLSCQNVVKGVQRAVLCSQK